MQAEVKDLLKFSASCGIIIAMESKNKWIIGIVVLLLLVGGAVLFTNPDLYRGQLALDPSDMPVEEEPGEVTLETFCVNEYNNLVSAVERSSQSFEVLGDFMNPLTGKLAGLQMEAPILRTFDGETYEDWDGNEQVFSYASVKGTSDNAYTLLRGGNRDAEVLVNALTQLCADGGYLPEYY